MSNIRLGPWDLNRDLFDQMEVIKAREGKTWRFMLTEGCRLFIASRGMVPHSPVVRESYAPAPNVERPQNVGSVEPALPAVPGVPVAVVPGVPVAVVPAAVDEVPVFNSVNEQRMYWLLKGRADKQALLDRAPIELEREPGSKRALNWLARMPGILAKYEVDIAECQAALDAERAAKEALSSNSVDNSDNGGEV